MRNVNIVNVLGYGCVHWRTKDAILILSLVQCEGRVLRSTPYDQELSELISMRF